MTKKEAKALYRSGEEPTVEKLLEFDREIKELKKTLQAKQLENNPLTPSGMTPVYLKPSHNKRKKRPGRKKGHQGVSRKKPEKIDYYQEHTLCSCPDCQMPLNDPIKSYKRYIEDIPPVESEVTEHTVNGYWCAKCKKVVYPKVTDAMPNDMIGLRVIVFTAWLHYLIGVSVDNSIKMLTAFSSFKMSPGSLTQSWKKLANLLESLYHHIGQEVAQCAVLNADETGWRINGLTHWLWCFTNKDFCYYIISRCRGSPVVKEFLGTMFKGILICDFWGAYNKISALAKQRCLYHLFTEIIKVNKHNASLEWKAFRKRLSRLLKDAIRLSNRKNQMDSEDYARLKRKLYKRLGQLLDACYEDKDIKRLIKRLKRHRNELFTFLEYEGISPYNSHAEQQMRKPVLTRKISQQNRSNDGAKTQAILMTLFRSAELQGKNPIETVLSTVKSLIRGNIAKSLIRGNIAGEDYLDNAA